MFQLAEKAEKYVDLTQFFFLQIVIICGGARQRQRSYHLEHQPIEVFLSFPGDTVCLLASSYQMVSV